MQDGEVKQNIVTTAEDRKLIQNWHLQNVCSFYKLHKCLIVQPLPVSRRCAITSVMLTGGDSTTTNSHSQEVHDRSQEVRVLVF